MRDEASPDQLLSLGQRASDNPVLRTQQVVRERVRRLFAYTRAVTFGNEGGR